MNKSRKNEIREKVKEIKQRQQNWMKQRAHIQNSSSSPNALSSASTSGAAQNESAVLPRSRPEFSEGKTFIKSEEESPTEKLLATNKSKAKFQNWLKAKESHEAEDVDDENDDRIDEVKENRAANNGTNKPVYRSALYSNSSSRENSFRVANSKFQVLHPLSARSGSTDAGFNSEDETGEITAATLLSPEDFDSRADDIIAKVKGDLKLSLFSTGDFDNDPARFAAVIKNSMTKDGEVGENNLSSHVCPTCEKLMMPPSCSAMLLIPCGHTLCSSCCKRTKYCALCGCAVQSSTPNIMLQQIITNFHTKQTHRQKTSTSIRSVPKKNYEEEYQNLLTRQEILNEEADNITAVIDKLSHQLNRERKQVHSIKSKEKLVEAEISKLQQQLQQLVSHRMEYERNCDEIEIQAKEETNRLNLVKDSLSSVQLQIDKVKLLAGH